MTTWLDSLHPIYSPMAATLPTVNSRQIGLKVLRYHANIGAARDGSEAFLQRQCHYPGRKLKKEGET